MTWYKFGLLIWIYLHINFKLDVLSQLIIYNIQTLIVIIIIKSILVQTDTVSSKIKLIFDHNLKEWQKT